MCGIIGYVGDDNATGYLVSGLEKLEYRGYDSAGIAVIENGKIDVIKSKGRLKALEEKIQAQSGFASGTVGIGHTRWATHGEPSDANSHPHLSKSGLFAVVHNGIIENFSFLKEKLISQGYEFKSETDTEVVAHLLEKNYDGDLLKAVKKTADALEGSYALGILCRDYPDEFVCVRRSSPLIVGISEKGNFIASDITAILSYTNNIYKLNDGEIALLSKSGVKFYDKYLQPLEKSITHIDWDISAAEKCGYEHFMIKEIMEQPEAVRATISPRIRDDGTIALDGVSLTKKELLALNRIYIVACGSAYHVGVVGKYVIEKLTRIPVEVDIASEFRYRDPIVDGNTLVIIISQSGETADTLAALRMAKAKNARVLSVVNVVGSSIASESDDVLYTWAGPEIAVATTKAYSTQLCMMYILAIHMAEEMGRIAHDETRRLLSSLMAIPEKIEDILRLSADIEETAKLFKDLEHAYFIGRNIDYAIALEASLKLKEISYIHSEAYGAGELKHGTISLIEPGTMVVALACVDELFPKTMSNIKEVKARGARVLCVTTAKHSEELKDIDYTLIVPDTDNLLIGSLEVIPMQLLGYYVAKHRGCDIDKPRNLAKSVTVE
ncbi:MAG: glutamine--fructose-6-phosphate transaminase (isomerizing) [Oscillospiraceae bacterium]|nr:glutamine--fructose-6-phosphate transaminase (isomerizing) [Oscillospiraceae bacterium]